MKRLRIHLYGALVGFLEQDEEGPQRFAYDPNWLGSGAAIPLSRQLPLRAEAFVGRSVRAFFSGILPEAEVRARIASVLGVSAGNDLSLLEYLGGECAGAVSILPEDAPSPASEARGIQPLDPESLARVVQELPRRPLMAGMEGVRLSLAGAQAKLPIVWNEKGIGLPLGATPSTHILKPEPERFPGLAANEAFCMELARHVGLSAAKADFQVIGGTPCLIIERYDRVASEGGLIERVHQEDFCQALGVPPERKYQKEGGPSLRDCFALLREWSTLPVLDIRDFLDAVIFAVLTGNADAHGKNFSFLYQAGARRLTPLYDQVCTLAWPELSTELSMKVGSAWKLAEVSPEHFRQLARETNLGWPLMRERLKKLSAQIAEGIAEMPLPSDSVAAPTWTHAGKLIQSRAKRMLRLVK